MKFATVAHANIVLAAIAASLRSRLPNNDRSPIMFHILWMIIVGFIAGLIARWLVPGLDAMGFWMTTGLGIVGAFVGGFVSRLFSKPADGAAFHPAGILMSIVGAVIVLIIARYLR
ncbi:MAG: GlsB/YeaQ/YmgE family stress response membrane protein [Betaproteobacteria bacterium]